VLKTLDFNDPDFKVDYGHVFFCWGAMVAYCVTRRVTLRGHGLLNITNHNVFILMQHATKIVISWPLLQSISHEGSPTKSTAM